MRIPASLATNGYWQQQRLTGDWTNLAEGVTTEGGQTLIRFSLEDGGPFDLDGAANGRLSALGGPGQDYVNSAPIPTLHPLVLAVPALLLAGLGWRMRQRFRGPSNSHYAPHHPDFGSGDGDSKLFSMKSISAAQVAKHR